jgi:hypothetical protein
MDISISFDTTGYADALGLYRMDGLFLSRKIHWHGGVFWALRRPWDIGNVDNAAPIVISSRSF